MPGTQPGKGRTRPSRALRGDAPRRGDEAERVVEREKGNRRDEIISCRDVILIDVNYVENSVYYNA